MTLHEAPFSGRIDVSTQIGAIAEVLARNPRYRKFQFAAIEAWLMSPILLGQTKSFFSPTGKPVAFVSWALVNAATEQRLIDDGRYILHPSEWHEGDRLVIMDFCANEGSFRSALRLLRQQHASGTLWPEARSIRSIRRNDDGTLHHVLTWYAASPAARTAPTATSALTLDEAVAS
ncbi:toxin-activating lysine-acyltransferase [Jeongeupia chitinilytica]|uniref:RTX toxin-activating lysine-acyltransferase n=1 Tax=Jeongeupia chitinilytica TaxID=1041641 RepID=A0ABQ3H1Q8_9NEIS|nr:toxin-activating lysine-acyltransferase [Jeongeupia chitinilytica]GHD64293.1 hypothetical protein GCM10007350_23150 [Jeongeupia chitinilytica]